ncbi:hypothetical protein [Kitasatospora sp. NPDC094015]|uniref:hypothetical protein n=1 Tax=Kitasatospora sp. NPDC094015 TaxID=3155205 RepID=UPI003318CD40
MTAQLAGIRARLSSSAASRSGDRTGPPRRRWDVLAGALVVSWALPAVLGALNLTVVLLPVFLLAVASVLRVGGVLLDRLVVATVVLCGGVLAMGLITSFWPWGMEPVPSAGVILSVISVGAWTARRVPRLPLRLRTSDLLVVGTAAAVWHYVHHPLIGHSVVGRLPVSLSVEDRITHFSIFDAIHRLGGFLFLDQDQARVLVSTPTEAVYPLGSHYLWAWFDIFVRSTTSTGDPVAAYNRYALYVIAAFAILCGMIVWAARWIGGPRLTGWRTAAVCTTVGALAVASGLGSMVEYCFDSQIFALIFLVVTVALVIRPAMDLGTYALATAAGMITVAFSYNILAAFLGLAMVGGAVVHRRRQRGRRWPLYAVQLAGCLIAVVPSAISTRSKLNMEAQANAFGWQLPLDRSVLLGVALLVAAVALLPRNRRTPVARAVLVVLAVSTLILGGFGYWQMHQIGKLSYYFEKLANGGFVIALSTLGLLGSVLRPMGPAAKVLRRRWWTEGVVAVAVSAAALSLFAGVQWGVPSVGGQPTAWQGTPLVHYSKANGKELAPVVIPLVERDLPRIDRTVPVLTLYANDGYVNWRTSFLASSLIHRAGLAAGFPELMNVVIGGGPVNPQQYTNSLRSLKTVLAGIPDQKVTLLVSDPQTANDLRHDLAALPGKTVTVVDAPIKR